VSRALRVFHAVALTALGGLAFQTLLNHRRLRRLETVPPPPAPPRAAVLIPARNEAARIGECVRAWSRQDYPGYEVLVFDDDSTDGTAAAALAAAPGVRVVRGNELPEGWRGKPHACHRLRQHTDAALLVFADADVVPAPPTLRHLAGAALHADALSAVPFHRSPSPGVRALAALQNWAALALVPAWLPTRRSRPLVAVMNGQLIAIHAAVYDATGGFAAVRAALGEDSALGRRLARLGYRVSLLDGTGLLACEPYRRVRDLWRANVRNLQPVFFGSAPLLFGAVAALAAVSLGPVVILGFGLARRRPRGLAWIGLPLAEIALALCSRAVADRRAGYPPWLALLHPLAVTALVGMGAESALRFALRVPVEWRGRRYLPAEPSA
jgi:cellulose synthase/poly-beta-1,6-N-acetylglucosamine synthase-like glycosyltransferase